MISWYSKRYPTPVLASLRSLDSRQLVMNDKGVSIGRVIVASNLKKKLNIVLFYCFTSRRQARYCTSFTHSTPMLHRFEQWPTSKVSVSSIERGVSTFLACRAIRIVLHLLATYYCCSGRENNVWDSITENGSLSISNYVWILTTRELSSPAGTP